MNNDFKVLGTTFENQFLSENPQHCSINNLLIKLKDFMFSFCQQNIDKI